MLIVWLCIYGGASGEWNNVVVLRAVNLNIIVLGQDVQFVQVREPSCSDGTSVYSCARNGGNVLFWMFELTGSFVTPIRPSSEAVTSVNVGSAAVTLNRTSLTDSTVTITATISYFDAVRLNGTYMDCNGKKLYINANLPSKYFLYAIITHGTVELFLP